MPFLHFLQYQIHFYIFRKRWLLPIPVLLFIAYRSYNALQWQSNLLVTQSTEILDGGILNAWDLLFIVLGNQFNVYFAIALLYLYLVCDLLPEPALGQHMLLRLNSRRLWWLSKITMLLIGTLVYVLGSTLFLALLASLVFPWQSGYSQLAMAWPDQINLPMNFFKAIQPPAPVFMLAIKLTLLVLGLYCIGLLMMVVTQLTQRYFLGLAAGLLFLFGSYFGLFISGPPSWTVILPSVHLTYTTLIPIRTIPVVYSYLYWGLWIVLLVLLGRRISLKQDHLANWELA